MTFAIVFIHNQALECIDFVHQKKHLKTEEWKGEFPKKECSTAAISDR